MTQPIISGTVGKTRLEIPSPNWKARIATCCGISSTWESGSTIGSTAKGIYTINQSYLSANSLYKNRFLYLHYGVVAYDGDVLRDGSGSDTEPDETARQIYAYIEINDTPKLEASLEQFQDTLRRNGVFSDIPESNQISLF